jgi:hypothetical protein
MAPLCLGVETSTAKASMAMSWVAEKRVNDSSTVQSTQPVLVGSRPRITRVIPARTSSQMAIHIWRLPRRSTNGAQAGLRV